MIRLCSLIFIVILLASGNLFAGVNSDCMDCHEDESLTGLDYHEAEISMFVNETVFGSSVHGEFDCVDCHEDLLDFDDYPHEEELNPVNCAGCHDEVAEIYAGSEHSLTENEKAPTCTSCHGTHQILPTDDANAMTSAANLPHTCASCHQELHLKVDPDLRMTDAYDRYMRGIHAEGIARGIEAAASCNDCHGMHDLRKAADPLSRVNKMRVPETCSKCHNEVYLKYSRGIHGKALAAGITDSPNCVDCHGEHQILDINDLNSPVNASNLSDYVCSRCHNDPQIVAKYGMSENQFSTYQDSYHGLAVKGGSVKAATCASCHEAHDILPSSNLASSIHPNNLTETCQKCHPQANDEFAASYTHKVVEAETNTVDTLVRNFYILMIIVVIGGMLLHNGIIIGRIILNKYRLSKSRKEISRFSKNMIFQHIVLFTTFTVLVITGFALKYQDQFWVGWLSALGLNEAIRSLVHRIAAVGITYISFHHLYFVFFTKRGREELKAVFPVKKDITDAADNMNYYLGRSNKHPKFDRYDYTEKMEYWALVWGTLIMGITGLVLWFPVIVTSFLPAWVVKIAETIHLYEAWLATLAIVVFHFFFVMFHPDRYPMSVTWMTGGISDEECREHHPLWHKRILEEEENNSVGEDTLSNREQD